MELPTVSNLSTRPDVFQDRVSCRRGNTAKGPIDKLPIGHVQKDIVVVIAAGRNRLEYQGMIEAVGQLRPAVCPCCEKAETLQGAIADLDQD